MGIKRKHFDDASPTSVSSFGAVSTPDEQDMDATLDMEMNTEITPKTNGWDFMSAHRVKPSDWGNRTRKRVRDNRPNERAIHENTVHKLFLAQREQPHASPMHPDPVPSQPALVVSKPQKSTLHSFWNISAPPVQSPIFSYQPSHALHNAQGPRCEDCDARLGGEECNMDVDMTMGGLDETIPFACCRCARSVCGMCAVVGDQRLCLQCATHGC